MGSINRVPLFRDSFLFPKLGSKFSYTNNPQLSVIFQHYGGGLHHSSNNLIWSRPPYFFQIIHIFLVLVCENCDTHLGNTN